MTDCLDNQIITSVEKSFEKVGSLSSYIFSQKWSNKFLPR